MSDHLNVDETWDYTVVKGGQKTKNKLSFLKSFINGILFLLLVIVPTAALVISTIQIYGK